MGLRVHLECFETGDAVSERTRGRFDRILVNEDTFEASAETPSELYRDFRREYGASTSAVYIDDAHAPGGARRVGWLFQKRVPYGDARRSPAPARGGGAYDRTGRNWYTKDKRGRVRGPGTYLQECWVTVVERFPTEKPQRRQKPVF